MFYSASKHSLVRRPKLLIPSCLCFHALLCWARCRTRLASKRDGSLNGALWLFNVRAKETSYLHKTPHWPRTSRCHGSHPDTRSGTNLAGWHRRLGCRTRPAPWSTHRYLREREGSAAGLVSEHWECRQLSPPQRSVSPHQQLLTATGQVVQVGAKSMVFTAWSKQVIWDTYTHSTSVMALCLRCGWLVS